MIFTYNSYGIGWSLILLTWLPHQILQRAWLLKLLAVELHAADMSSPSHRETCQDILSQLLGGSITENGLDHNVSNLISQKTIDFTGIRAINKIKVMMANINKLLFLY